jgi:hypothetical protein
MPGKNVCTLYNAAWNIAKRLHKVNALLSDASTDILTGLTKARNDDFTYPVKLIKDLSNLLIALKTRQGHELRTKGFS